MRFQELLSFNFFEQEIYFKTFIVFGFLHFLSCWSFLWVMARLSDFMAFSFIFIRVLFRTNKFNFPNCVNQQIIKVHLHHIQSAAICQLELIPTASALSMRFLEWNWKPERVFLSFAELHEWTVESIAQMYRET